MAEQRLIDANVLISQFDDCNFKGFVLKRLIELQPTVDAAEVVHGRWKQAKYTQAPLYICSECDKPEYKQHRFCPNCGARMDGEWRKA